VSWRSRYMYKEGGNLGSKKWGVMRGQRGGG
jgi:hypothetical protein